MKIYNDKCFIGEGPVYVLESFEDWDEYEKILGTPEDFLKFNPNFYKFKEDFKKYFGTIWHNHKNANRYKVIAFEDNNAWSDWYYVLQNIDDERDIIYYLPSGKELLAEEFTIE